MTKAFESPPPLGGENIPFKELKPEKKPVKKATRAPKTALSPKDKKKSLIIKIILIVLFLATMIGGISLGFYYANINQPPPPPPSPSPSPSPSPESSVDPEQKNLQQRIQDHEKNLNAVDLQELDYAFPILDFELRKDLEDLVQE